MKKVYGYIRVSTVKQGIGVSLQEQKEAIIRYAEKHDLSILEWFEEKETAAKQGRTLFTRMMKLLQSGKAAGVIIHKIDRSARNLKDWAALGDLIDQGIEVHFAHESLDLDTRGGRLAADIQAVIASDYIRNLRDEAKKGLYGRLKQGIYPFGAPIGYLNNGGGKVKTIDPVQGPLVRKAFELYASGKYTLLTLLQETRNLGLCNSRGQMISRASISYMLNNPFYAGILAVKGKSFKGEHEPLISSSLFFQVQDILKGKTNTKIIKHDFLFRKMVKCLHCGYLLTGENQKGHVYYRCHSKGCITTGVREEHVEREIERSLAFIGLRSVEYHVVNDMLHEAEKAWFGTQKGIKESLDLQQGQITQKLNRLTEAYIEGAIDKASFEEKKERLLIDFQDVRTRIGQISDQKASIFRKARNFFELIKTFKNNYLTGNAGEKRKILKIVTSNLAIEGKKLIIAMKIPFQDIANRSLFASSALNRTTPRIDSPDSAKNDNFPVEAVDTPELRTRVKELLDIVLVYCTKEVEADPFWDVEEEKQVDD